MANSKQAEKRVRQNRTHYLRNHSMRSMYRTCVKKILTAIEAKDKQQANAVYTQLVSTMDKLAGKGIVSKNKVARHKSRLNKAIQSL